LLTSEEEEEKKKQEAMSIFLVGMAFGGAVVGGYFFCKWIFSTKAAEVAMELAEETTG
jgi:nitrate reductase NapE component